jgi:ribonuclease BN (tRNA processing enzyme)
MELRILGCHGGIGGRRRTTSLLLDGSILIDAGSGVGDLTLAEMAQLRHVFITHSHLDHIHALPLLIDSVFDRIERPLRVYASTATLQALRLHIFNWMIWPDFTVLPDRDNPVLEFVPIQSGVPVVAGECLIEAIDVNHTVPAVAYLVQTPSSYFCFSGDTTTNDTLWARLNQLERLDMLVVEAAFSNDERELCRAARHYCPDLLAADLLKLRHQPELWLSHAKPGEEAQIYRECASQIRDRVINHLSGGEMFEI